MQVLKMTVARAAMMLIAMLTCASVRAAEPALLPLPTKAAFDGADMALTGPLIPAIKGCDARPTRQAISRASADMAKLAKASLRGKPIPLSVTCNDQQDKESYRLITSQMGVRIEAASSLAVIRALATLRQLVRAGGTPAIAAADISDTPRFAWRGLMIDTARHFMPVAAIKRQIDAMELVKLNILHLGLSNNEAFRVESRRYPKLTAANAPGESYSQAEMRDLVLYARARGIEIVPEFNLPGHSLAILGAYPELSATPIDPKDPRRFAKAAINVASPKTMRFVEALLGEMMPLFPGKHFHIGGDEVTPLAWQGSPEIDAFKAAKGLKSNAELESWFHTSVHALLKARGKTLIGWEEIGLGKVPPDIIVEVWRTSNPTSTETAKGRRVIVAAGYYLDLLRPVEAHYAVDPLDPTAFTTMSAEALAMARKGPFGAYVNEHLVAKPLPPLTPDQQRLVLGAEAPLWSEIVNGEMLDFRLWPRAAAVAERFWSDAKVTDPASLRQRLLATQVQARTLGLRDESNRRLLLTRLAPGHEDVVATLLDATAPIRNHAHARAMFSRPGFMQPLDTLADAASTDSPAALRFASLVDRLTAGDDQAIAPIRTQLERWRDNESAYAAAAKGRPKLEAALPTSRNLARLARAGLAALGAIESRAGLTSDQQKDAQDIIARLEREEAASIDLSAIATHAQPPADLIVRVTRDAKRLLALSAKDLAH
jgi:hexosaminidase